MIRIVVTVVVPTFPLCSAVSTHALSFAPHNMYFVKGYMGPIFQADAAGKDDLLKISDIFSTFIKNFTEQDSGSDDVLNTALGETGQIADCNRALCQPSMLFFDISKFDDVKDALTAPQQTHTLIGANALAISNSSFWNQIRIKILDNEHGFRYVADKIDELQVHYLDIMKEDKITDIVVIGHALSDACKLYCQMASFKIDGLEVEYGNVIKNVVKKISTIIQPMMQHGQFDAQQCTEVSRMFDDVHNAFPIDGDVLAAHESVASLMVDCISQQKVRAFMDEAASFINSPVPARVDALAEKIDALKGYNNFEADKECVESRIRLQ